MTQSDCIQLSKDMLSWYKSDYESKSAGNGKNKIDTSLDKDIFEKFLKFSSNQTVEALKKINSEKFKYRILKKIWPLVLFNRLDFKSFDALMCLFHLKKLEMRTELSWIPIGGHIVPHTDAKSKIFSGLIYLNQSKDSHLGTSFWKSNLNNYKNTHLSSNALLREFDNNKRPLFQPDFNSKKMYFFLRNSYSWHSLEEVSHFDINYIRLSININLLSEDNLLIKRLRKLIADKLFRN